MQIRNYRLALASALLLLVASGCIVTTGGDDDEELDGGIYGPDGGGGPNPDLGNGSDTGRDNMDDDDSNDGGGGGTCQSPQTISTSVCQGGATVGGDISSNTTWSGCVKLQDTVTIKEGAAVTLQPGTTVVATGGSNQHIDVQEGALKANGSSSNKIVFTSETRNAGAWGGIQFRGDTQNGPSVLEHAVVEYAGGNGWGSGNDPAAVIVKGNNVTLDISNTTFQNSAQFGLYANTSQADISVTNATFVGNEDAAELPAAQVGIFDATSQFANSESVRSWGGTIEESMTWDRCVPYLFTGNTNIKEGALVTVNPEAVVRFASGKIIDIRGGKLNAVGSEDETITFTKESSSSGPWGGISFTQNTLSSKNKLEHVVLKGAGGTGWGSGNESAALIVKQKSVKLTVRNTTFTGTEGFGLYINSTGADVTLVNNTFEGNDKGAAALYPSHMNAFAGNSTFESDQQINVWHGKISEKQTWHEGLPFELQGGVEIASNASVTVEPGATVTSTDSGNIYTEGSFNAEGSQDNPITFTGVKKQAGAWGGIRITGQNLSDDNVFNHVTIEYGGGNGWGSGNEGANLLVGSNVKLALKNTTLQKSSKNGIYFNGQTDALTCENVTFEGNATKVGGDYSTLKEACQNK